MKMLLKSVLIWSTLVSACLAKPLNLNEILESACRVSAGTQGGLAYGTGTTIAKDTNYYYILTNAHVVGNNDDANVEYFKGGFGSEPIHGSVVWRKYMSQTDVDFAIIAVDEKLLKEINPRIIPLAPGDFQVSNRSYISAAGCPHARWAQAWEGHILNNKESRFIFTPPPESGQSGSGIMVNVPHKTTGETFTRVGAVLTWRLGDGTGGAIPIKTLYAIITGKSYTPTEAPSSFYQPVAQELVDIRCNNCGRSRSDHAIGSDKKLYCISTFDKNGDVEIITPPGIKITQWPVWCPGGRCPILPPRTKPNPKPGPSPLPRDQIPRIIPPILAPWPGQEDPEEKPEEKPEDKPETPAEPPETPAEPPLVPIPGDEIPPQPPTVPPREQIELERLQQEYGKLRKELDDEKEKHNTIAGSLNAEITILKQHIEDLEKKHGDDAHLPFLSKGLADLKIKVTALEDTLKQVNNNLSLNITSSNETKQTLVTQRNVLGGLSGLSFAGIIGLGIYICKRVKQRTTDIIEKVPDGLKNSIDQLKDLVKNFINSRQDGTTNEANGLIARLKELISQLSQQSIPQDVTNLINQLRELIIQLIQKPTDPTDHPDYQEPPPPIDDIYVPPPVPPATPYNPIQPQPSYPTVPSPYVGELPKYTQTVSKQPYGLGPIYPDFPSRKYTQEEVLSAVDEVARRHQNDVILRTVPTLVRQILNDPKRPIN